MVVLGRMGMFFTNGLVSNMQIFLPPRIAEKTIQKMSFLS